MGPQELRLESLQGPDWDLLRKWSGHSSCPAARNGEYRHYSRASLSTSCCRLAELEARCCDTTPEQHHAKTKVCRNIVLSALRAQLLVVFQAEVELCVGLQSQGLCVQMIIAGSQVWWEALCFSSFRHRLGRSRKCLFEGKMVKHHDRNEKQMCCMQYSSPDSFVLLPLFAALAPVHQKLQGRSCTCRADLVPF